MSKKLRTVLTLVLLFVFLFSFSSQVSQAVSYDYEGHWAEQTIKLWIEKGYVKMYEDGTFRPDSPITRVEFITLINKLLGFQEKGPVAFSDVQEDQWFYEAVSIASQAGYITGKGDGTFGPNQEITREEASAMLGRALGLKVQEATEGERVFRDLDQVSEFAMAYVESLLAHGLVRGDGDNIFRPRDPLTRAEAVVLLDRAAGLLGMERVYYTDRVAVLMYHSVRTDYKYDNCIHQDVFRAQMEMLKNSGFNPIDLQTFMDFLEGRGTVPPNAVLITFDDGYEDFYKLAYPILKELEIPATMFVITSKIGDKSGWNPKLDVEQILEMAQQRISFGSHSHDGHYLVPGPDGKERAFLVTRTYDGNGRLENGAQYYQRVYKDLATSKKVLDALLDQDTKVLALPYGQGNSTVQAIADFIGLDYIFTIKPGVVYQHTNKQSLPRINAGYSSISDEELKNIILRYAR